MIQVTVEDFLANATVYFANLTEEGLIITENGRQIGVLNPPATERSRSSFVDKYSGILSHVKLSDDFNLKQYLADERWKDYENLN